MAFLAVAAAKVLAVECNLAKTAATFSAFMEGARKGSMCQTEQFECLGSLCDARGMRGWPGWKDELGQNAGLGKCTYAASIRDVSAVDR